MSETQQSRATAVSPKRPTLEAPELESRTDETTNIPPIPDRVKKVLFTEILREHSNRLFCWECGALVRHSTLAFHLWDEHTIRLLDYRQKHGPVVVSK